MSDRRIIDLSVPIGAGMPVFPGDPDVRIAPALTIAADGVNVLAVHMGSQSGTHVDAPFHILDDGLHLDELPLERFLGRAVVADLRAVGAESPIAWAHLSGVHDQLAPGAILLLHTGWSRHWGDFARMRTHPWLSADAAERIAGAGVRTVGIDALSVDPTPQDAAAIRFDAHVALLEPAGVIVENLTNLEALIGHDDLVVSVLPIALARADGAPVRAVAYERGAWPGALPSPARPGG